MACQVELVGEEGEANEDVGAREDGMVAAAVAYLEEAEAKKPFGVDVPDVAVAFVEDVVDILVADWQQEEMDEDQVGGEEPLMALRWEEAASALLELMYQEMG